MFIYYRYYLLLSLTGLAICILYYAIFPKNCKPTLLYRFHSTNTFARTTNSERSSVLSTSILGSASCCIASTAPLVRHFPQGAGGKVFHEASGGPTVRGHSQSSVCCVASLYTYAHVIMCVCERRIELYYALIHTPSLRAPCAMNPPLKYRFARTDLYTRSREGCDRDT